MRHIKLTILALLLVCSSAAFAGGQFQVKGQIRHRFEMRNTDFDSDTNFNNFNLLRTRIGMSFEPTDYSAAFVQVQDSRMFGEETATLGDGSADNIDFHQAYLIVNDLFNDMDLKLGRFEAKYGPERLLGAVGWDNVGRSFDGAVLTLEAGLASVDLFSLKEVEGYNPGDAGDKNVFGAYADLDITAGNATQAFIIWQQLHPVSLLDRMTLGLYENNNLGSFHYTAEFAYQSGKITAANREQDVAAMMFGLNLGYKLPIRCISRPDVSVGVDYLSGDDDPEDDKYKVFDSMYATNHKYYGYMDYFTNIPVHTHNLGLLDTYIRVVKQFQFLWMAKGQLDYHLFNTAEDYTFSGGSTDKALGGELDLTLKMTFDDATGFQIGASFFTPGKVFEEWQGKDSSSWFYVMTTVNF